MKKKVAMVESVPFYFNIVALICTVGAIAIAIYHIYMHLVNYTEPTYQRFIVRIIFMVPVSTMKFLYMESIRKTGEAMNTAFFVEY